MSATGIEFCERDGDVRQEVEQAQPAIEEQATELQSQAQERAQEQDAGSAASDTADLTGSWLGENGFTYLIEQFGDQAMITETGFDGLITAVGSGFVDGSDYTFDVQAIDGSVGTGFLTLDGDTLSGSFDNAFTGISTPAVLHR